jgi:hypothetical protein
MQSIGSTEVKVKSGSAKQNGKKAPRRASTAKETLHLKTKEVRTPGVEDDLTGMIATAAYFYAEQRRFEPGHELDDWLTAERLIKSIGPA